MTGLRVEPASKYASPDLARLATRTFEGYALEVRLDAGALEALVRERSVDLAVSPVLFDGDTPVGLALLGHRGRAGYVAELGVVPAARGRGVGRTLVDASLRALTDAGATTCTLEVLAENARAISTYESAGFTRGRRLPCYRTRALVGRNLDVREVPLAQARAHVPADLPWPNAWPSAVAAHARAYRHAHAGWAVARPAHEGLVVYDMGGPDPGAVIDGLAALHAGRPATYQNVTDPAVEDALKRRGWTCYATQVEMTRALKP